MADGRECAECGDDLSYWNEDLCDWCDIDEEEED